MTRAVTAFDTCSYIGQALSELGNVNSSRQYFARHFLPSIPKHTQEGWRHHSTEF